MDEIQAESRDRNSSQHIRDLFEKSILIRIPPYQL